MLSWQQESKKTKMLSKKATAADVYWGESKKATYLNSHFEEDTRLAQGKVT